MINKDEDCILYGIHSLYEAVMAGRPIDKLFVQKGKKGTAVQKIIEAARRRGISVRFEDRKIITLMVGNESHQGVVGFIGKKDYSSLETLLEDVADKITSAPYALFVIMDEINDPGNVGAIIRTAEAVKADGVVLPSRRNSGMNATVAKAASGALEYMQIARVTNMSRAIEQIKEAGIWVYGLDVKAKKTYIEQDFNRPVAVVIGNEEKGLRRLTMESCDELVSIPVPGNVESLNVSVSLGVFSYEVLRQRSCNVYRQKKRG